MLSLWKHLKTTLNRVHITGIPKRAGLRRVKREGGMARDVKQITVSITVIIMYNLKC